MLRSFYLDKSVRFEIAISLYAREHNWNSVARLIRYKIRNTASRIGREKYREKESLRVFKCREYMLLFFIYDLSTLSYLSYTLSFYIFLR